LPIIDVKDIPDDIVIRERETVSTREPVAIPSGGRLVSPEDIPEDIVIHEREIAPSAKPVKIEEPIREIPESIPARIEPRKRLGKITPVEPVSTAEEKARKPFVPVPAPIGYKPPSIETEKPELFVPAAEKQIKKLPTTEPEEIPSSLKPAIAEPVSLYVKPRFKPEPEEQKFRDIIKSHWKIGSLVIKRGELGANARDTGLSVEETLKQAREIDKLAKSYRKKMPEFSIKKPTTWLPSLVAQTTELIPYMGRGQVEGMKMGIATGVGFGTMTALWGQAGPQVLTPEEVLTIPGAMAVGGTAGWVLGSLKNCMDIEGGNLYIDLLERGVKPKVAKQLSLAGGLAIGAIEVAQIGRIARNLPGFELFFRKGAKKLIASDTFKNILKISAKEYAKDVGYEIGEEEAQEIASMASEFVGSSISPGAEKLTFGEAKDRLKGVITQSALGFTGLLLPGQLYKTIGRTRALNIKKSLDALVEEKTPKPPEVTKPPSVVPEVEKIVPRPPEAVKEVWEMTKEELKNLEIPVPEGGASKSPKTVFSWKPGEYETLHDVSQSEDEFRFNEILGKGWEGKASLHLKPKIKNNEPITVYRASDYEIIPGSYVSESIEYAKKHGENILDGKYKIHSLEVKPSELLVYGDPHEFIYVPESIEVGHKRIIEKALSEGKPVPKEVLEDYPELQEKAKEYEKPEKLEISVLDPKPGDITGSKDMLPKLIKLRDKGSEMVKPDIVNKLEKFWKENPEAEYGIWQEDLSIKPVTKETLEKPPEITEPTITKVTKAIPEKAPAITGRKSTAKTEAGTEIEFDYDIYDINDIIASHDTNLRANPLYPAEKQPRGRARMASEAQINKITRELAPERLGENPLVSEGAPIVDKSAIVESGNARIIALQRLYESKSDKAKEYKQFLIDNAEKFGLDVDKIRDIANPVLVRRRLSDVDIDKFIREANVPTVAAMSATEQALSDAKMLSDETLAMFDVGETGEIDTAANRDFVRRFFKEIATETEYGRYFTKEGLTSQEGINRIRNAIFAKAYENPEIVEKLSESTDVNIRNIVNAMVSIAPRLSILKNEIKKGNRHKYDITKDIAQASEKLSFLRNQNKTVDEYIRQTALFDDEVTPLAKDILKVFDKYKRSPRKIRQIFNNYINLVDKVGNPKQANLFEEYNKPKPAELLQEAINEMEDSYVPLDIFKAEAERSKEIRAVTREKGITKIKPEKEIGKKISITRPFAYDSDSTVNQGWFAIRPVEDFDEMGMGESKFKTRHEVNGLKEKGISFVVGTVKGKEQIQRLSFNKDIWTEKAAKEWWNKNFDRIQDIASTGIKPPAKVPEAGIEKIVEPKLSAKIPEDINDVVFDKFKAWPKKIKKVGEDYWTEVMAAAEELSTPYRYKSLRQTVVGKFEKEKGIKLQDVTQALTATHELGHNIDWLLNNKTFPGSIKARFPDSTIGEMGLRNELKEVSKVVRPELWEASLSEKNIKSQLSRHTELMADFITHYILDPENVKELAPDVTALFEAKLANKPELFDIISRLQQNRYTGPERPAVAEHIVKALRLPEKHEPLKLTVDLSDKDYVKTVESLGVQTSRNYKALIQEANLQAKRIDELVPDKDRQTDLVVIVEKGSKNPWTGETREEILKRGINDKERKAINLYRAYQELARQTVNEYLKDSGESEYIKFIEDYFIHAYETPMTEKYKNAINKWAKSSPQAKKRILPDLATAVELELKPRVKTLSDGLKLWSGINYRVATNKAFLEKLPQVLNEDGMSVIQKPKDFPAWPTVDYWPIRRTYRLPLKGRGVLLFQGQVAVDPKVKPFIDALFGQRFFSTPARILEGFNAVTKACELTLLSLFHHQAEFFSAVGAAGWRAMPFIGGYWGKKAELFGRTKKFGIIPAHIKFLEAGKELEKVPEFMDDYLKHGGQVGYITTEGINVMERMLLGIEEFLKNVIEEKPISGKAVWAPYIPLKAIRKIYSWNQHLLWDNTQRAKLLTYYEIVKDGLANSDLPVKKIKETAAKYTSDDYGWQEWLNTCFRNPKTRQVFTQLLMSLDWTWSQIKMGTWPFRYGGKTTEQRARLRFIRRIGRRHWFRYMMGIAGFTIAANYAINGKGPWENEKGHKFNIDWTNIWRRLPWNKNWKERGDYARRYISLGKAGRELIRWTTDPLIALGHKLSPAARTMFEQATGYNVGSNFSEPWARDDLEEYEEVYARFKNVMEKFVPFALSGNNAFLAFPSKKGMTQWKAIRSFEDIYKARARIAMGGPAGKISKLYRVLNKDEEKLIKDITEACKLNGVDAKKAARLALANIRSNYYRKFWQAAKDQDVDKCNKYVSALVGLGVELQEIIK